MENTNKLILSDTKNLLEAWCDRRCFSALRHLLDAYPIPSHLTDSWAGLLDALENVRAFAWEELTNEEKLKVNDLIALIIKMVNR